MLVLLSVLIAVGVGIVVYFAATRDVVCKFEPLSDGREATYEYIRDCQNLSHAELCKLYEKDPQTIACMFTYTHTAQTKLYISGLDYYLYIYFLSLLMEWFEGPTNNHGPILIHFHT